MITQAELKALLDYNPDTGVFIWKHRDGASRWNPIYAGKRAGCIRSKEEPYRRITINGVAYAEHRLAWLYVHGYLPSKELDHRNCVKGDNRIANLREATQSQNHGNELRPKNNVSGVKGVSWRKKQNAWRAKIMINGKTHWLGNFKNIEDAKAAYWKAAVAARGEFARAA